MNFNRVNNLLKLANHFCIDEVQSDKGIAKLQFFGKLHCQISYLKNKKYLMKRNEQRRIKNFEIRASCFGKTDIFRYKLNKGCY